MDKEQAGKLEVKESELAERTTLGNRTVDLRKE
jgi:hypothetical protein